MWTYVLSFKGEFFKINKKVDLLKNGNTDLD